jgi:hypothetical protein
LAVGGGNVTVRNALCSGASATGFHAHGGGAHIHGGALTMEMVTFANTSAGGGQDHPHGGGVFLGVGQLVLNYVEFIGVSAIGLHAFGGGIYASGGVATISNTAFTDTIAKGDSARGGGLEVGGSTVTVHNATFTRSSVSGQSPRGGGLYVYEGNVTIVDAVFVDTSVHGDASGGVGAGVAVAGGALTLGNATFIRTRAAGPDARGSSVYVYSHATLELAGAHIVDPIGVTAVHTEADSHVVLAAVHLDTSLCPPLSGAPLLLRALTLQTTCTDVGTSGAVCACERC